MTDEPYELEREPLAVRSQLEALITGDLLGPAGGANEIVDETRVSDRYALGMLAPIAAKPEAEGEEQFAVSGSVSDDDGATDTKTAAGESLLPSSIGMTFTVDVEVDELVVSAAWGRYERTTAEILGEGKRIWQRYPMQGQVKLQLIEGAISPIPLTAEQPGVVLRGLIRKRNDEWIVSVFLVNAQQQAKRNPDEQWVFQPELSVEAPDGTPIFMKRAQAQHPGKRDPETFREMQEMAMLYRKEVEFAVGHGVAVHAETPETDPWRAFRVSTVVLPFRDVPQQTAPEPSEPGFELLAGLVLDMSELAECSREDIEPALSPLIDAYAAWIERESDKINDADERLQEHRESATRAIEKCERALGRIQAGIDLLKTDEQAAKSFRFANRAMQLQRVHSKYSEKRRRGLEVKLEDLNADPTNFTWRTFQMAFILLNLPSATDLHHPDRSHESDALVDLLWFPTGGGKTEAYLGLAAYTLALRRLQGEVAGRSGMDGVAVLMRYTLRLLTLQQFQRATALMCACEVIRREDEDTWGTTPFRIGLWVGKRATPNTTDQAADAVLRDKGHGGRAGRGRSDSGSPAQFRHCPWCGSSVSMTVETVKKGRGRTLTLCGEVLGGCEFTARKSPGEGLPVVVVDEEIYRLLPSMIIATVDKFAQMPWNGRTQMLFGQVDKWCPRHGFRSPEVDDSDSHPKRDPFPRVESEPHGPLRPPDLIIQDELHLISGPLGSLVGLYETAVDELCTWEVDGRRVRPKVIASTATIRNANAQVNSLFLRNVDIFPPPGTCIDDNFFSVRRKPSEKWPGRRYLGVCAPGKRLKALLIRTYIALLGASQKLYDEPTIGAAADPWMTLIGYFNSLRELGGMRRLVDDDIRTRLRKISIRGLGDRRPPFVEELTSRKSSTDIPEILDRLEVTFDPAEDAKREAARKKGQRWTKPVPYDVVLATNMLSVGVDVQRLGLMVAAGQPKTTAEYIQATSRVGRRDPGLIVTVYNWARPRDLSHYERFEHYHDTFYERVESLSVTPFAPRALDRAISGLLVALVRLPGGEFNANEMARALKDSRNHDYVKRAIEAISARAAMVTQDKDWGDEVKRMLEARLDEWIARAGGAKGVGFSYRKQGDSRGLLSVPSLEPWDDFTCLNSLRDVEPTSGFILVEDGMSGAGSDEGAVT